MTLAIGFLKAVAPQSLTYCTAILALPNIDDTGYSHAIGFLKAEKHENAPRGIRGEPG
jgi:hypothetical protein